MTYILLVISLIVSFFILYELSRNDFVLLRKNISLTQMFDYSIVSVLLALVVSRIFYIINAQRFDYLYPVSFLHVLRLPGLSLLGFFVGCVIVLYTILYKKKVTERVYDIFFLSFYPILLFVVITMTLPKNLFFMKFVLVFVLIVLFGVLLQFLRNYVLKDGSISIIFFMIVCLITFFAELFTDGKDIVFIFSLVQILSVGVFVSLIGLFVLHQQVLQKRR